MIRNAATGNFFNLNGGTEYIVPRKRPKQYRDDINDPKFSATIKKPKAANDKTSTHAEKAVRSPAAIGKYGLLTLHKKKSQNVKSERMFDSEIRCSL